MILKIAGRGANGRLIAKEIKNVTYVTMAEEQVLLYQVNGEDYRQELGGLMWEVCEEEKPEERPVPEKEIHTDVGTEKKSVLNKKSRTEDNLEEAVMSMSIQLEQNTQKGSTDTDEPDDMGKEKTDDIEEMEM